MPVRNHHSFTLQTQKIKKKFVTSYFSYSDSVEVRRGQVVEVIDVQQLLLKLFFLYFGGNIKMSEKVCPHLEACQYERESFVGPVLKEGHCRR